MLQGHQSRLSLSSPVEDVIRPITNESSAGIAAREENRTNEEPEDVLSDDEILEGVEKDYFVEAGFDPSRHELKVQKTSILQFYISDNSILSYRTLLNFQKVGQKLNCDELLSHSERLHRQQKVVSKKVLSQILTNQRACNEEFER